MRHTEKSKTIKICKWIIRNRDDDYIDDVVYFNRCNKIKMVCHGKNFRYVENQAALQVSSSNIGCSCSFFFNQFSSVSVNTVHRN